MFAELLESGGLAPGLWPAPGVVPVVVGACGDSRRPFSRAAALALAGSAGLAAVLSPLAAGEMVFRRHAIDPGSTYEACAAIDVNRDGRLDIFAGGWWYEAPRWERRFVREVEVIRGRFDDYSNLPLDVNRDGWTDIVSANYRSGTLYWVEHPGAFLSRPPEPSDTPGSPESPSSRSGPPWARRLIAEPGPMETARLFDVDGDGAVDVLPNGVRFAAWWELASEAGEAGEARGRGRGRGKEPRWVRRDLAPEVAGHGVGFGDVNGDGRGDVVGPRGWLEAPEDRRRGEWRWHPEFELHRDASVPILVRDVDGDGDQDLVWGRGHGFGLYWLEQLAPEAGEALDAGEAPARRWRRHAIDTSWSQAHALVLADLDGDGAEELVAGSRHLAHDGNDLGEHDPMVIHRYAFDRGARVWRRAPISWSWGGGPGFGLDPKAADLDRDGDLDLIAPGRSGLYWLENLRLGAAPEGRAVVGPEAARPAAAAPERGASAPPAPGYADHARLLVWKDEGGNERPVTTLFEWGLRRAHVIAGAERAMGELPGPSFRVPLDVEVREEVETPDYVRRKLAYSPEPGDRVPAYLLLPRARAGRRPAILCLHQTTAIGKGEPAALGGVPNLQFGDELARRGYVCLIPDYPSFGEYAYDFAANREKWASGTMKAVWNNLRALDLLESLPHVDPDRIGAIGHSLGGHNAIFTAVFDQRLRAVVSSCGFTAFHRYYGGKLAGWTSDRYMPRLRDVYGSDPGRVPFDFHELVAAIAPRAFFASAPLGDSNFDVTGVKEVVARAAEVYALRKAPESLRAIYPDCGHDFPPAAREEAYAFLARHLGP
jgi:dienelactone hydrolase